MSDPLQALAWLPVWVVFSIVVHELGHAAAAKMVGLRVGLCGIGIQKALVSFGVGRTRYFFGLWPINGLTLLARDNPRLPVGPMVFSVAAGPLVNLLVGLLALGADRLLPGAQPALSTLAGLSFLLTLNLLPIRSKGTGFTFRTDGMMILQLLRGTQRHGLGIGVRLRNHEFLRSLGEQVRSPLGQTAHELALAFESLRTLGWRERGEELLNRAVARQSESPELENLPEWTRALRERFGQIELSTPGDVESFRTTARPYFLVLRAERLIELDRRSEAVELLDRAIRLAGEQGAIDAAEAAEIILLELRSPEDFAAVVSAMLERAGRHALEPISRVRVLSWVCSRLDGSDPRFSRFYSLLRDDLRIQGEQIGDPEMRDRFLERWLRPVAGNLAGSADSWLALAPVIRPFVGKPHSNLAGRVSLWLWFVALALSWTLTSDHSQAVHQQLTSVMIMVSAFGFFFGGVGLARPETFGKKAAFLGTLGNAMQLVSICGRCLADSGHLPG